MLPVELLERILRDVDWTSVKNCSLVSPTFHSLVRPILFHRVTISLEPDREARDSDKSGAQFFDFLVDDATAASFIRGLSLHEKRSSRADDTAADWQSNADKLILLLPKLTRLKHLSIQSAYFFDWTLKNVDLRAAIVQLCLLPRLQSLHLSFIRLQQSLLLLLTSIPKLTLFCIDATSDPAPSAEITSPSSSSRSTILQDLTITAKYSDDRFSAIWSIVKKVGGNLTSLRIYSSPYDGRDLPSLDSVDLRRHPSLLSLAICIPLTSDGCIAELVSIFSPLRTSDTSSRSRIKCIEICCDVDLYSFPCKETVNMWNWASLDAILSSDTYENLERLEITVKKVIRSRTTSQTQRRYTDLEGMVVHLFSSHLPVVSQTVEVVEGPSVEGDS